MILAVALLAVGLATPYGVRRWGSRISPTVVIAAQLAGLALTWLGVVDLASVWAMPEHGLLGLCRAAFFVSHDAAVPNGEWVLAVVSLVLCGGALQAMSGTCRSVRSARRSLAAARAPAGDGVVFADLGTVACTVGFVRPHIVIDRSRFEALSTTQQRAIVAHERSHVRGWHALIDLAARGLAAGIAPWPGGRVAYDEIRRHLEAVADDCAARRTSRRDVAAAIIEASRSPWAVPVLGAAGWAAWRVDRLLTPPRRLRRHTMTALALIGLTVVTTLQLSGHATIDLHLLSAPLPCCTG